MSVKIYDRLISSIQNGKAPLLFDRESGEYKKTSGYLYDREIGEYRKIWEPHAILNLYNYGDECTEVTGGYTFDSGAPNYSIGTYQKFSDHISMSAVANNVMSSIYAFAVNDIDITRYKKFCIDVSVTSLKVSTDSSAIRNPNANASLYREAEDEIALCTFKNNRSIALNTRYVLCCDIPKNVSGGYKVMFGVFASSSGNPYMTVNFYRVWLEK